MQFVFWKFRYTVTRRNHILQTEVVFLLYIFVGLSDRDLQFEFLLGVSIF